MVVPLRLAIVDYVRAEPSSSHLGYLPADELSLLARLRGTSDFAFYFAGPDEVVSLCAEDLFAQLRAAQLGSLCDAQSDLLWPQQRPNTPDASCNRCHASSNRCLTTSNKDASCSVAQSICLAAASTQRPSC